MGCELGQAYGWEIGYDATPYGAAWLRASEIGERHLRRLQHILSGIEIVA